MAEELPFDPFPYMDSPHRQTIGNGLISFYKDPPSSPRIIALPDGDRLSIEITTPPNWKPTDPTVMLLHGLCGSHRSPNLVRMTHRLSPLGIRVVRFNMRGCGSGKGLAREIYHSGRNEDVFEALKVIKAEFPESPIVLIGFSLGGNLTLKLAGELGTLAKTFLKGAIAISPPTDLHSSVRMLGDPVNSLYERYFYKLLRADVYYRHNKFKDLPPVQLPRDLKLYEFDQLYTAPHCKFESAEDYYDKCSSAHLVPDIAIPCKILLSQDDPIISSSSLDHLPLPPNVQLFKTQKGGHMGYLGKPTSDKGFYWLDSLLVEWIHEILSK
ncbi:MAG TPA: alpha/beta fold hydrolase [Chlamydiales bacterium]|nr:alpha/beta fold hydrolase [Chlamydiales bacterium]